MKRILASLCLLAVVVGCTTRTATLPDGRVLYKSARFATDENMKRVEFRTKSGDVFILEGYAGNQTDAIGIAVEAAVKAALASSTGGASALRSGPPTVPPGYKLVPIDDPSTPKPEIETAPKKRAYTESDVQVPYTAPSTTLEFTPLLRHQ